MQMEDDEIIKEALHETLSRKRNKSRLKMRQILKDKRSFGARNHTSMGKAQDRSAKNIYRGQDTTRAVVSMMRLMEQTFALKPSLILN